MSLVGEEMETVIRGAAISALVSAAHSQFNVSPRVATCLGAHMTDNSSAVSLKTSTTSTAPLKTSPKGRRHLEVSCAAGVDHGLYSNSQAISELHVSDSAGHTATLTRVLT